VSGSADRGDSPVTPRARVEPRAERWRCFVAIDLGEPARSAAIEYLERLRATIGGVAWTRPENLHLTLKFLGDVAATCIPSMTERLRLAVAETPAFTLEVGGVGAFPSLARPQTIWIGVTSPALLPLAAIVESACEAEGFERERRAFQPHLTLGRVRDRRTVPDLVFLARDGSRALGTTAVTDVTLFRSELGAGGARHSALARLPLAAP
jgi:2'-5' RNA ligase